MPTGVPKHCSAASPNPRGGRNFIHEYRHRSKGQTMTISLLCRRKPFLIMFFMALIVAVTAGRSAAAESGKPTPLRLAYSAITVNQAIPWIAHDAGHFKKHGLDVELVHASSTLAL